MYFNPKQSTIYAKKSSLAVSIHHDTNYELSLYIYNRKNHSIVAKYELPLMEHCRRALLDVLPIKKKRRKK